MYNKYLGSVQEAPVFARSGGAVHKGEESSVFSSLASLMGGKLKKKRQFTSESLIAIAVIFFILFDSDEYDTDLLVILGILFFLGI